MSDIPLPEPDAAGPPSDTPPDAKARSAKEQVGYVLSLPERLLRSGTGLLGGVLRESASLLVPRSFQSSKTYTVMVQQMLDFLVHDVGGVASGEKPPASAAEDNFVARKAIGNFVDMASLATLHVSPMMLLAIVSDVAYGSGVYLKELADELKAQGVIDERSSIHHVNDLLTAVSDASAATAGAFNTPPLSVDALRQTVEETRAALGAANPANVLPQEEVRRMWEEMREISRKEGVSMLAVSGAATMCALGKIATVGRGALSGIKVAGALVDKHILSHYWQALGDIRQRGFYASLAATSQPYAEAVWHNFQPSRATLTEEVVSGRMLSSGWRAVRKWLGRDAASESPPAMSGSEPLPPPAENA